MMQRDILQDKAQQKLDKRRKYKRDHIRATRLEKKQEE